MVRLKQIHASCKIDHLYKLLSEVSGPLVSGKLHMSGHMLPCSIKRENIFSSWLSGLIIAPADSTRLIEETSAFTYLPIATGTRSSTHRENWVQNL
jgi:hypothetical protein